jgi:hypothetical protein
MKSFALLCFVAVALAAPAKLAPTASLNCTEVQTQLEKGIQANLDIQAQELKGYTFSLLFPSVAPHLLTSNCSVHSLQLQSGTGEFETTQQSVLSIQQKGITIRANNQKLAAEIKSPAADGLAVVAGAQTKEMMQVMSLKGTAADADTLKQLVQEVQDGTKQNEKNLATAKGQKCAK